MLVGKRPTKKQIMWTYRKMPFYVKTIVIKLKSFLPASFEGRFERSKWWTGELNSCWWIPAKFPLTYKWKNIKIIENTKHTKVFSVKINLITLFFTYEFIRKLNELNKKKRTFSTSNHDDIHNHDITKEISAIHW